MKKNEVIWEHGTERDRGGVRIVMLFDSKSEPHAVVIEHRRHDTLGADSWQETGRCSSGAGEGHAAFWLWHSVWEANARQPVRLAKSDAETLMYLRGAMPRIAVADDDRRSEIMRLFHRLHMAATRQTNTLDTLIDQAQRVAQHWRDQEGINAAVIDDLVVAVDNFNKEHPHV